MAHAVKPPVSKRLLCCVEQAPVGARVADIGADHGYLSIALLQSGRAAYVHASDLREQPIRRAMENALRCGVAEKLRFSCADGLRAIRPDEVDTVVCAGMGGDLIAQILSDCEWIHNEKYLLILQPQSSGNDLRRKLFQQGFGVEREILTEDGGFLYCIIRARFGNAQPLTPGQQYVSPQLLQCGSPLLARYIERIERALTRTVAGIRRASDPTAQKRLAYYETALNEVLEMRRSL